MTNYEQDYKELASNSDLQVKCNTLINEAMSRAEELFGSREFDSKTGWKLETENSQFETTVYSKKDVEGKLFCLRAELPCPKDLYFNDFWHNFPNCAKWNPAVSFAKLLVKMGDQSDIAHYGNKDMFTVKARDFLIVRGFKKLDNGSYLTVGRSIHLPTVPEGKDYVRGEILLGAGRFSSKKENPNVTIVDYLLAIDLKGLLPKVLVNTFMSKLMLNDVECNRKHAIEIAKQ